ncbi:unnamed protein product [Meganyctiphanes norvegica]|uniref:Uncharacterized protein n=1 Tax=Meganyctiphanes norvegica TaxID=48144 RepID=A0AAV2QGQ4_MEGNR
MTQSHILLLWILSISKNIIFHVSAEGNLTSEEDVSRSKRFVYYTSENRLSLPPGTMGFFASGINLPFVRNSPVGYGSDLSISIPFEISFDDLGYTSAENPWGLWPEFFDKDALFGRKKRQAWESMDGVNWAGGDREMVFHVIEDYLLYLGMKGKPCLLRAICETFETPLLKHGLFGEFLQLIFSVSNSIGAAQRLGEYLEAEKLGKKHKSCSKYYDGCSKSLYTHNAQRIKELGHNEIIPQIVHKKHENEAETKT